MESTKRTELRKQLSRQAAAGLQSSGRGAQLRAPRNGKLGNVRLDTEYTAWHNAAVAGDDAETRIAAALEARSTHPLPLEKLETEIRRWNWNMEEAERSATCIALLVQPGNSNILRQIVEAYKETGNERCQALLIPRHVLYWYQKQSWQAEFLNLKKPHRGDNTIVLETLCGLYDAEKGKRDALQLLDAARTIVHAM